MHGNNVLLGCEPQLSPISVTTVRRRSGVAVSDGITPLWTTDSRTASVIDQAPWARIDRMDWRLYLEPNYDMPVRGGVRGLTTVRCTPGTVCNDKKLGRRCSGWNSSWEPRQLNRFDDLIARAAATELRPVKQQTSVKRTYWFWASTSDLAEVDLPPSGGHLTVDLGPVVSRNNAASAVIDERPLDETCTYEPDTASRDRTRPRDSEEPVPVRRLSPPVLSTPVVLDWSDRSHVLTHRQPCRLCGRLAFLADDNGVPCHKVCAERAMTYPLP